METPLTPNIRRKFSRILWNQGFSDFFRKNSNIKTFQYEKNLSYQFILSFVDCDFLYKNKVYLCSYCYYGFPNGWKKWQIEHIDWVDEGVLYQYNRGASNNDNNFDDNYVIFSRDFTGSYITSGTTFNTSWSWNDATKTGLTYIIHNFAEGGIVSPNSNFTISWQNVSLTDSTFRYTEMYTHNNGSVVIGSGERTPVPTTP